MNDRIEKDILINAPISRVWAVLTEPRHVGTRLRLVESGFAAIDVPADRAEQAGYDSHEQGWAGMLGTLATYAEKP